uniref:Uncharacterized protein n=1 Tax=Arundo donax TaxID=35708 RepID=A0A0A9N5C0_ARUDO
MAAPPLLDELVEEILLRVPPDEPAGLVRAALACKGWCRLVSGPGFRRRFRQRHRRPPLLGILRNFTDEDGASIVRFVPTCSFRPAPADRRGWYALDARHGRVLLHGAPWMFEPVAVLAVWNPVTDEQRALPALRLVPHMYSWNAAVLCAAAAGDCDHLDCHHGPFLVVFVGTHRQGMSIYVYSSESDTWSKPASALHLYSLSVQVRGVHVGNTLYFVLENTSRILMYDLDTWEIYTTRILKYDLGTWEITLIDSPPMSNDHIVLTTAEGGGLGSATVKGSIICLWSREAGPNGDMGWRQIKVIDFKMPIPDDRITNRIDVVGFADGGGVIYVGTDRGSFITDLNSERFRKVGGINGVDDIVLYLSFYTPALGVTSIGEGPRDGASHS